jgi:hypothetical protein
MSFFLVRLYPQLFVWRAHVFFPGSSLSPVICKEGSCLFSWFVFIPSCLYGGLMSFFLVRLYPQLFVRRAHVFFPGSSLSLVICTNEEKRHEPSLQITGDKDESGKKT